MTQVLIKRAYDPYEKNDGFRVLVDRLWPRGIKKEDLHYDLWTKGLAPSTELREWFHVDPDGRWEEFKKRYMAELAGSPSMNALIEAVKGHKKITLLYGYHDTKENQAVVLQELLDRRLNRS